MKLSNLTRDERARLCTALNRQYQNGLRATSETLQFFTEQQIMLVTYLDHSVKDLMVKVTS